MRDLLPSFMVFTRWSISLYMYTLKAQGRDTITVCIQTHPRFSEDSFIHLPLNSFQLDT